MLDSNFLKDKLKSKVIIKEKKLYEDLINTLNLSEKKIIELDDLNNLALEEDNQEIQKEVLDKVKDLRKLIKTNEIKCFLSKESDSLDCYLEIHAGAGGTESQDWADMLRRMYLKWSDNKNLNQI